MGAHVETFSHQGLLENSDAFDAYLAQHEQALRFATLNRELIVRRMLDCLGAIGEHVLDVNHNLVSPVAYNRQACRLNRKGATPADAGLVMIPGSRGDYCYLVISAAGNSVLVDASVAINHIAHSLDGLGRLPTVDADLIDPLIKIEPDPVPEPV